MRGGEQQRFRPDAQPHRRTARPMDIIRTETSPNFPVDVGVMNPGPGINRRETSKKAIDGRAGATFRGGVIPAFSAVDTI